MGHAPIKIIVFYGTMGIPIHSDEGARGPEGCYSLDPGINPAPNGKIVVGDVARI
jgi:hypothetical protein